MSKRATTCKEITCYGCEVEKQCEAKCHKNKAFYDIVDMVYGNADFKREDCPLYIAITTKVGVEND